MKFYSEVLKKFYDTMDECLSKEAEAKAAEEAQEKELNEVHELEEAYLTKLDAYIRKYGSYKSSELKINLSAEDAYVDLVKKMFS